MRRDDFLDLNDVLQHPGRQLAVDLSTELPNEADVDLIAPLEGFLEAISTGNVLIISGDFHTRAVFECARCATAMEADVEFTLDEQFPVVGTPSSLSANDYARVAAEEPYQLFEGNNLIVEQLLRQGLLLSMPLQPVCENCRAHENDAPETVGEEDHGRPEFRSLQHLLDQGDSPS